MFNYNSGETQSSIKKFEQMLKTNLIYFFDAQEFEDIVVHYLGFGENHLAKKALKMGLDQHPDCLPLLLLQSEVLIIDEKFEMALQLLEYVEKLSPYDEEIALQRASIASKKGDHKTSISHLHKALEISEDPIEIWNLLGMEHLLAEEYEEASYFFKNCVEDNPEDYPSLYNLLYCYEQLDQEQSAIDSLNKVLEHDPYCEVAWHQLGKILMKIGKMKEALSALDFAIISDDSFTGAFIEKGKVLETMGKINEAIENYEVALNSNEPSAFLYKCIGRCHEQLGNTELAKQFYLKSIKLEPSNEKSWEALVHFFITQKNYTRAKFYIEQALETNSDAVALWKLGLDLYSSMKNNDKAIQSAQKLLELGNQNAEIKIHLIDLLLKQKRWEEAHEVAEEAFAQHPKNKDLALRIAGLCFHLNRTDEGLYLLNPTQLDTEEKTQFSSLFPDFKTLLAEE